MMIGIIAPANDWFYGIDYPNDEDMVQKFGHGVQHIHRIVAWKQWEVDTSQQLHDPRKGRMGDSGVFGLISVYRHNRNDLVALPSAWAGEYVHWNDLSEQQRTYLSLEDSKGIPLTPKQASRALAAKRSDRGW